MKKQNISIIAISGVLLLMLSIFNSCTQEETFAKATVETNQVTSVTEATATCGGIISSDGGSDVTVRGVCWSTSPNPTVENDTTVDAAGTGSFTSVMKGLSPSTTYYVRAYAINKGGNSYGLQMIFTTKTLTFTTIPASFIMAESAISGGMISSDGDSLTILDRGVCWNTLPYPTIADSSTHDGRGKGSFTSTLTGLKPFTTYFARAFVTNSIGTTYGNDISFTTQNGLIDLTTTTASNIKATYATIGGKINGDGGSTIKMFGVCWSTSPNPTMDNNKIFANTFEYHSAITGLNPNTTYYVRAFGINNIGTFYGNEISFSTPVIIDINTTNMVAYFPFDGNSTETLTNLNPSSQSNVTYVTGRRGKAFQGANGAYLRYILPSTSKLKTIKSFTVAMWFRSPLVAGDPEPIIMQIGKSDDLYWGNMTLGLNRLSATADSLQMKAYFLKSGAEWSGQHISYSNTMFKVNQWMHLVFEYNGATSKYIIFKNGVKVVTNEVVEDRKANSAGDALGNLNFVNADVFNIGSWRPKSEGTATDAWMGWFRGNIDELRIYENALTEIEVKDLYDAEEALTN